MSKKIIKKKVQKKSSKSECTVSEIIDSIGTFAVAFSILVMAFAFYKTMMHLIAINKLT